MLSRNTIIQTTVYRPIELNVNQIYASMILLKMIIKKLFLSYAQNPIN